MKNITRRTWQKNEQYFVASYNHDTNDIERVTVSREGFDVALGWDSLTLAEQHEIENKFADVGGYAPHVATFGPTSPNWENSIESFLCKA